jgi:hypothetical protein
MNLLRFLQHLGHQCSPHSAWCVSSCRREEQIHSSATPAEQKHLEGREGRRRGNTAGGWRSGPPTSRGRGGGPAARAAPPRRPERPPTGDAARAGPP